MAKCSILRVRIDPRHKAAAERVLKQLGVTPTQAISMLYAQIIIQDSLPFSVTRTQIAPTKEYYPNAAAGSWAALDSQDYSKLLRE